MPDKKRPMATSRLLQENERVIVTRTITWSCA